MMPGQRCCIVGCEEQVAVWVLIRIFDLTLTKQDGLRPFCDRHRPAVIDGTE